MNKRRMTLLCTLILLPLASLAAANPLGGAEKPVVKKAEPVIEEVPTLPEMTDAMLEALRDLPPGAIPIWDVQGGLENYRLIGYDLDGQTFMIGGNPVDTSEKIPEPTPTPIDTSTMYPEVGGGVPHDRHEDELTPAFWPGNHNTWAAGVVSNNKIPWLSQASRDVIGAHAGDPDWEDCCDHSGPHAFDLQDPRHRDHSYAYNSCSYGSADAAVQGRADRALTAFYNGNEANGDNSGYDELAEAIHYLQDVSNAYHITCNGWDVLTAHDEYEEAMNARWSTVNQGTNPSSHQNTLGTVEQRQPFYLVDPIANHVYNAHRTSIDDDMFWNRYDNAALTTQHIVREMSPYISALLKTVHPYYMRNAYSTEHPTVSDLATSYANIYGVPGFSIERAEVWATADITHTWVGDMQVYVEFWKPGIGWGSVLVWNREGGSADDVHKYWDIASLASGEGSSLWTTTRDWRLRVYDAAGGDTGKIDNFDLVILPKGNKGYSGSHPIINDMSTVEAQSDVAGSGSFTQGWAHIDVSHTWRGDLNIDIGRWNGGTSTWDYVRVYTGSSGDSADNVLLNVDLDSIYGTGAVQWSSTNWRVRISDNAWADTGKLEHFWVALS